MLRMTWKVGVNSGLSASWQVIERYHEDFGTHTPGAGELCGADLLAVVHAWQVCTRRRAQLNAILGGSIPGARFPNNGFGGPAIVVGSPVGMNVWKGFTNVVGGLA
jgi:hypothetical protein